MELEKNPWRYSNILDVPVPDGGEATTEEGTLLASAGGVSVLLLWRTDDEPLTPGESVIGSFEVLQQSTGLAFALAGSGQEGFDVDGQTASYATFAATEDDQLIGVALIAGWTSGNSGRSFALTVSGTDQAGVADSFYALAEGTVTTGEISSDLYRV